LRPPWPRSGFLAEVNHPGIVKIFNFVRHRDNAGTTGGYIVMEYVGGSSLKQLTRRAPAAGRFVRSNPGAAGDRLRDGWCWPATQLPARARAGLYCDFKPENAIQYERQLKLIDLGAVLRMDDRHSTGCSAPSATRRRRVGREGPSPASDGAYRGPLAGRAGTGSAAAAEGQAEPAAPAAPGARGAPVVPPAVAARRGRGPATPVRDLRGDGPTSLEGVACCGRLSPPPTASHARPARHTSARPGPPSRPACCWDAPASAAGNARTPVAAGRRAARVPLVDPTDPDAGLLTALGTGEVAAVTKAIASAGKPGKELRATAGPCPPGCRRHHSRRGGRCARCSRIWRGTGGWTGTGGVAALLNRADRCGGPTGSPWSTRHCRVRRPPSWRSAQRPRAAGQDAVCRADVRAGHPVLTRG